MTSKPVLSDADKKAIRKKLEELYEECWIAQGYKKTGIWDFECAAVNNQCKRNAFRHLSLLP